MFPLLSYPHSNIQRLRVNLSLLISLRCTFLIGLIFLAVDSVGEVLEGKTEWIIRFLVTLVNLCIVASATYMYNGLRNHMEIGAWYLKAKDNNYSFAQIVSLSLLWSSIIPLFKSFIGKFTLKYELRLQSIKLPQNLGVYRQNRRLLLE